MRTEPQSLSEAVARVAESQKQLSAFVLDLAPQSWERAPEGEFGDEHEIQDATRALVSRGLVETRWVDAASDYGHKMKMWRRVALLLLACLAFAPVARADLASDSAAITANAAALQAALAALSQRWTVACTGDYAIDTPAIQGALDTGAGIVRLHGTCVTNAALSMTTDQVLVGDGACNVVAPDDVTYPGKLQAVAAVGACTTIKADPATMAATPFDMISVLGVPSTHISNIWVNGITVDGQYLQSGGTVGGLGTSLNQGVLVEYADHVTVDSLEATNVSSNGFSIIGGSIGSGVVNSYSHDLWHNCIWGTHVPSPFALRNYTSDCSQSAQDPVTHVGWDGIDWGPAVTGGVTAWNTVIDNDILAGDHAGAGAGMLTVFGNYVRTDNGTGRTGPSGAKTGISVEASVAGAFVVSNYLTHLNQVGASIIGGDTDVHVVGNAVDQSLLTGILIKTSSFGSPTRVEVYGNTVAPDTVGRVGPAYNVNSTALAVLFGIDGSIANTGTPQNLPPIGPNFRTP